MVSGAEEDDPESPQVDDLSHGQGKVLKKWLADYKRLKGNVAKEKQGTYCQNVLGVVQAPEPRLIRNPSSFRDQESWANNHVSSLDNRPSPPLHAVQSDLRNGPCPSPSRMDMMDFPCYFSPKRFKILIVKRICSDDVTRIAAAGAKWLRHCWNARVYVEAASLTELESYDLQGELEAFRSEDYDEEVDPFDLAITLGGDGTTLWLSSLFEKAVPPLVGVSLGSLSYLTQFRAEELVPIMQQVMEGNVFRIQLRMRLHVIGLDEKGNKLFECHCANECVVDRGPRSVLGMLDVLVDDNYFTSVSADGLIIATPTGSTAYSMSAGGAVVHPNVPCILFTPVCPHSLSMRPLVLPDHCRIELRVPTDARGGMWISCDGHERRELPIGYSVRISVSPYSLPLICKSGKENGDSWLEALKSNLFWGIRVRQRHLLDSESGCGDQPRRVPDDLAAYLPQRSDSDNAG